MNNFIEKSLIYPKWWHNIGTGWPRTWWRKLLWYSIGGGGYYSVLKGRDNPIYRLYWFYINRKSIRNGK